MARKATEEALWREYFREPCHWWDNRNCKIHPEHPDFKHKVTKESLWVNSQHNPSWVGAALIRAGLVEVHGETDHGTAFVALLRACAKKKDLSRGIRIHDDVLRRGLLEKCRDALVTMYAKCGVLEKAQALFKMQRSNDVKSWTALIAGFANKGRAQDALKYFEQMQLEGVCPDAVTYTCILKACGSIRAADNGEKIHNEIAIRGFLKSDMMLCNSLIDMYAKCGKLTKAQQVFEKLPMRNVISWTVLIAGYADHDKGEKALNCFEQMQREGFCPDTLTFICILKACGNIRAADKGEKVHNAIAKQGLLGNGNDIVLGNALVDMYARCGSLIRARRTLEQLRARDVISWTALIAGYAEHGESEQALNCFELMQREGFSPNAATFFCIVKACSSIGSTDKGESVHDRIAKQGLLGDDFVLGNALVNMYAKCGALTKARQTLVDLPLRNTISWTALIGGYAEHGEGEQVLECLKQMKLEGLLPDSATFSCVLNACTRLGLLEDALTLLIDMRNRFCVKPTLRHYTCMVDLLGRAGHLDTAGAMIGNLPSCDHIVWSALLGSCQKWGDALIGSWAFEGAVQAERDIAAGPEF